MLAKLLKRDGLWRLQPRIAKILRLDVGTPEIGEHFRALHECFETQVDRRPDAVAVEFGDERTTYGELERRANRLARHLRARGVERGSLVAILLPRSTDAYAALLGVLKSGAAYVAIDPDYPGDRVAYILENSGAQALVTTAALVECQTAVPDTVIRLDADRIRITAESDTRILRQEIGIEPRDLCYVIYTSGSTGHPKGVMIEHRNACHLVCVEGRIFRVRPEDRVYQGFSLSFDASIEEIWLAFHAGATLVAATPEMAKAGPELSRFLTERGVTVLSSVPTLLSMLEEDIPTLRLLIFGAETCPGELVARWSRPGRRIVNTYGPTESTVIATYADVTPEAQVTIGRPLPGYRVHVRDEALRPVPQGEAGEICIGGNGVARGYIGLPEETGQRFVPDPIVTEGGADARIYRTGDRGRVGADGNLEFLGRIDAQVKLRGYRVELSEIESALVRADGVLAAACAVREAAAGIQQLIGYVVPRNGAQVDEERLRGHLRERLPAYMIPALIETLTDLPRLPSGKLDRASLPAPRERDPSHIAPEGPPRTDTERRIAAVWADLFHPQPISVYGDFFLDLGGHSLLAARMVSELRGDPDLAHVSVADVYAHPTIESLAAALEAARSGAPQAGDPSSDPAPEESDAAKRRRHFSAGLLQSAGLIFVFAFRGAQWATPYLVYFLLLASGQSVPASAAWAVASALGLYPVLIAVGLAVKWHVLGRIRPGRYRLWGGYHLRWWFVHEFTSALHLEYLAGTPLLPFVYRLLGARIGRDVHLGTDNLAAFDLISIGDGASIEDGASLLGYSMERDALVIGPVTVGRDCFVGTAAALREGAVMKDGARIEDLSLLPAGAEIPRGQTSGGSPAGYMADSNGADLPRPAHGKLRRAATVSLYAVLALVIPALTLCAFIPGVALLTQLDPLAQPLWYLAMLPLVGGSFVLLLTTGVVVAKRLLVGRVRPGTYPVHGSFYVRKWIVDRLLALSLGVTGSLHATLYLLPWYRALGAKLGRFVEVSTATSTTPDLIEIGDGGTVADEVSFGAPRIEGGWMTLESTRLGRRAFVGNGAVLRQGAGLADGSLVGVLSVSPRERSDAGRPGTSWMGSPPIRLPRRQQSAAVPDARTYAPPAKLWWARCFFEILRVTLPPAGFILVTTTMVTAALSLWGHFGAGGLLFLPLVYAACCGAIALMAVAAKWAIVGRYRPFEHPLWSLFVWRLELVNALYEFLATPLALGALRGTPLLAWYLRLLGARIGRCTCINTTGFLEWDLVDIGDEAVLNEDCVLQTHLFEDRILKASSLRVGRGCEIGVSSVVLYDSVMQEGARLDALSLLMKGETLPAGTAWTGIPASRPDRSDPAGKPHDAQSRPTPASEARERRSVPAREAALETG